MLRQSTLIKLSTIIILLVLYSFTTSAYPTYTENDIDLFSLPPNPYDVTKSKLGKSHTDEIETTYFKIFPFPNGEQFLYFHGQLNATNFNNTESTDSISFTLSNQFLSYYTAVLISIQFYDRDAHQPLSVLQQYPFKATDRDVSADIPLTYDLTLYNTQLISYSGYFQVLKRNKPIFINNSNNFANEDEPRHFDTRYNNHNDEQAGAPTQWQILATYYPQNKPEICFSTNVELVYAFGSTVFHPDTTVPYHAVQQLQSDHSEADSGLDQLSTSNNNQNDNNYDPSDPFTEPERLCTNPLSPSPLCNRLHLIRTPAGKTTYQYSFRVYIGEITTPIVGFNITLFGGLYGYVYDKSGCKMNSLTTRIVDQYIDEQTGLFTASIQLRDGYQRGDPLDYNTHSNYFAQDANLDIWCWFATDLYHNDIAAGVVLKAIPDPVLVNPLDLHVITMFTDKIVKLDTVTNHVINPYRAMYNVYEIDSNQQPSDEIKSSNDDHNNLQPHSHQYESLSPNHTQRFGINDKDPNPLYHKISCEWFISSEIPFLPQYFNDTFQLAIYNLNPHVKIEEAVVTYTAPSPHVGDSILKNTNLIVFNKDLIVQEFKYSPLMASSRLLFQPMTITLDPVTTLQVNPTITRLAFSVLTSIHHSQLDPTPGIIPQCTLQYQQLYPGYHSPTIPTRVPIFYTLTNKPSFPIFSRPHQWLFTATETDTHPHKYAFNILIFNMTVPRPIKWVLFDLVTSEYRFEGQFSSDCIITVNSAVEPQSNYKDDPDPTPEPPPIDEIKVRPLGQDQRYIDDELWTSSMGFDFYYEPNRYYSIHCPDLYLIRSNLNYSSAEQHDNNSKIHLDWENLSQVSANLLTSITQTITDTFITPSPQSPFSLSHQSHSLKNNDDDDMIPITMFGTEEDQYIASYQDYYYAATTIRFTHDEHTGNRQRLLRLLIQLSVITVAIVASFTVLCCCFLDEPVQSRANTTHTSVNDETNQTLLEQQEQQRLFLLQQSSPQQQMGYQPPHYHTGVNAHVDTVQ